MKLKTLSGKLVHPIGIGTWGIGGTWEPDFSNDKESIEGIRYSISKGQNHIDTAELYGGGHTDEVVGQAINEFDRQDLYVANKLWKLSVGKGKVRPAIETMLKKLGTDYLDLVYIHKPWDDAPWQEAIPQLNKLIDTGIVRHFGVSNFDISQIKKVMSISDHPVVASQLHFNVLYKQEVTNQLQAFCRENDIQIVAYKPVERSGVLQNESLQRIAKDHKSTTAQVAIAWLMSQQALPIPKATQRAHIDENLGAMNIVLSAAEIKQLDKL